MKRILCVLLALLLLLCGCETQQNSKPEPVQPFSFYYRVAEPDSIYGDGPIGVEVRDLGEGVMSDAALISLYLAGPEDEALVSPFPPNVRLLGVNAGATLLRVQLSEEYATLQGVDASIADACLAKTLLGLDAAFRRVRISVTDGDGNELRAVTIDPNDILLRDEQSSSDKLDLTLYFADAKGQYLLSEKRTVSTRPANQMPQYVMELLLQGPESPGLFRAIPPGTALLDINVEGGVCAVDFSSEFLRNRGTLDLPPHLTLLSIANTLTELDGVDIVRFYIEGRQEGTFGVLPLNQDYTAETRIVGPSHPDLNEQDCTLCLPIAGRSELYPLLLRVRSGSNESPVQTLVGALFSYAPQNGLDNPWYGRPMPQSVTLDNGICTVLLSGNSFQEDSENVRAIALHMLYETLRTLEGVQNVQIAITGSAG